MAFDPKDYTARILRDAVEVFAKEGPPDVFKRYDLPLEADDAVEIKKQMDEVTAYWNTAKSNFKFSALLSVLLSKRERDNSRGLLDEQGRRFQREVVRAERASRDAARLAEVDQAVGLISLKGYVTAGERERLVKEFSSALDEKTIVSRIKVPTAEAEALLPDEKDAWSPSTRKQVLDDLQVLKKKSIHHFLEVEEGASPAALQTAWQERHNFWKPKTPDHMKSAADNLLGHLKTELLGKDPKRYEATRSWLLIEQLDKHVGRAAADNRIDASEFERLLEMAVELGIERTRARDYIIGLAQRRPNILVSEPAAAPADSMPCAHCGANQPRTGREECGVCHQPLWLDCPKCKARVPTGDKPCPSCRFLPVNRWRAELEVRKARVAMDEQRWEDAVLAARAAEGFDWLPPAEAAALVEKATRGLRDVEETRARFDELVSSRKLHGARNFARSLPAIVSRHPFDDGKSIADLAAELDPRLSDAERHVQEGRGHEHAGKPREAVFSYEAALGIAVDDDEARKGLARCPPEPPRRVRAEMSGVRVAIEWEKSPAWGDLRYRVVRGEAAPPLTITDGVLVAETTELACTDTGTKVGATVFYSVFAERGGAVSAPARTECLLVMSEVRDLTIEAGDASVRVRWSFAPGARARVRVWRREAEPPHQPSDGTELGAESDGFVDRGLTNGRVYYYRVAVECLDASGRPTLTPGLVTAAQPIEPPVAVEAVWLLADPPGLIVSFTPPPRGEARIHRMGREPSWTPGARVRASELAKLGAPLPARDAGSAADRAPPPGKVWYVAATVAGDAAVIGAIEPFVSVPDVSRVSGESFGSYMLVRWAWPENCVRARLVFREDAPPTGAADPRGQGRAVTRAEYEAAGGFRIERPASGPHHIAVYAESHLEGKAVFASALARDTRTVVAARPVKVHYTVSKRILSKVLRLRFTADEAVPKLPAVALMARFDGEVPIRPGQGTTLAVLDDLSLPARLPLVREVPLAGARVPLVVRAMFRETEGTLAYQLVDPDPRQLRVT